MHYVVPSLKNVHNVYDVQFVAALSAKPNPSAWSRQGRRNHILITY